MPKIVLSQSVEACQTYTKKSIICPQVHKENADLKPGTSVAKGQRTQWKKQRACNQIRFPLRSKHLELFSQRHEHSTPTLCRCSYCSSYPTVPIVPLFLCSSVPLFPRSPFLLFLCSSVPTVPTVPLFLLFLCAYFSSVPLFLCSYCSSVPRCAYCSSVPRFFCSYVPTVLLCLCSSVPLFVCAYCSNTAPLFQVLPCSTLSLCHSVHTNPLYPTFTKLPVPLCVIIILHALM